MNSFPDVAQFTLNEGSRRREAKPSCLEALEVRSLVVGVELTVQASVRWWWWWCMCVCVCVCVCVCAYVCLYLCVHVRA